ncbi:MAG: PAS domain S-box protein [Neisseriaceae bacterium]
MNEIQIDSYNFNDENVYKIIDLINSSIYWTDAEGNFLGCNKYVLDLFGFRDRSEIIGKNEYDLIIIEEAVEEAVKEADKISENRMLVLKNGYYKGEESFTIIGNKKIVAMTTKIRLLDKSGKTIILGNSIDITDTKKIMTLEKQQAILAQEAKTMQIIDLVDASIYWKDTNGYYLGCNKYVLDMYGVENRSEIIGKTDYNFLPQDEAHQLSNIDKLVLECGYYKGEEYGTIADGSEIIALTSKTRLLDKNGKVIGIVGTSIDITAQKQAQKENEHLEQENHAHMVRAEEDEKFRKAIRQLVHDINAPISSINNIISRLNNIIPENERITLRNASERIAGISQRLLSQYDKQADEESREVFLASLALTQIINERREDHRETGVIIELNIDEEANFSCIEHNSGLFKRMISNLVKNAVEALKDKSDGKVSVELAAVGSKIVIIIEDNGYGMPQHIQEMFMDGIEVTEGKEDGNGIGLQQVRDAIIAGDGTYKVHASENGTRITIRFPIVNTPKWIATEIKLTKDDTVIILDDDNSIHGSWNSTFKEVLEENPTLKLKHFTSGHEVVTYINGLTLEQKQDIFLLTDFELLDQGISGLDVVTQTGILRAILVTSYSGQSSMQKNVVSAGIKMLPKELASAVKISVDKKIQKWSNKVDMVWVEDQKWLVDGIVKRLYSHLKVDIYYDPITFLENVHQYPLDTRIILDTYYDAEDGTPYLMTGYNLAKELHAIGYSKLIIYTGEDPGDRPPEYLQVVRKKDPFSDENMDKI